MGSGSKPTSASIMRVSGRRRDSSSGLTEVTPAWSRPQAPSGVSGQAVGAAVLVLGLSLSPSKHSQPQ